MFRFNLNDQELPVVARLLDLPRDETDAVAELRRRYPVRAVAITCGSAGSRLYAGDGAYHHPGYPTRVADTVGAGDAFTAVLAVGLLRGEDPSAIHDRANRVASYVCSRPGATPDLPADLVYSEGR